MTRSLPRSSELTPQQGTKRKPMSLTRTVYLRLREEILTCSLAPGLEVSEAELAESFEVSKTPVREALAQLRQEGLVRTFPRRGYQISPITFGDMNELFDLRTLLEAGAAEMACRQITEDQLAELRAMASMTYEKGESQTISSFIAANRNFHMAIATASGNSRLVKVLTGQLDALERFFYIGAQMRDVNTETNTDHVEIVKALSRRDAPKARELMVRHNDVTRQGLFQSLAMSRQAETISI